MSKYEKRAKLSVDTELCDLIENEIAPGLNINMDDFWWAFSQLIEDFSPINQALLNRRSALQQQIDEYHKRNPLSATQNTAAYEGFLQDIGYIEPVPESVEVTTSNVDAEISKMAGPQLVVPVKNARFALNAANARWGSLYDAYYGTNAIPLDAKEPTIHGYNPKRGAKVIHKAKQHLDTVAPLLSGTHNQVMRYRIEKGQLIAKLTCGQETGLTNPKSFVGCNIDNNELSALLFKHNGLHVEVVLDANGTNGKTDPASVQDILVEAALSTIMDCEDSVAAVDAEDKIEVYRNWLGLMKGNLHCSVQKNGKTIERRLAPDRQYLTPTGETFTLSGRSLLFVRNVGLLMSTDAVLDNTYSSVPEGILDAVVTSMAAMHDLRKTQDNETERSKTTSHNHIVNSREGSIYIVKPKLHGSDEVKFSCDLFTRVEDLLGLPRNTIKIGVMDEERRTSVNLTACIEKAKERIVFINTGFLDRTGDEIHTSMHAGAFVPKSQMKQATWLSAYEALNVNAGLKCGLSRKAQIGKGMWPMPDEMASMLEQKRVHPSAGANTAWVPSPTAAVLHSLHYHEVDVFMRQELLVQQPAEPLSDLLNIPIMADDQWYSLSPEQIQQEIDNSAQGILGYVVRWIDQGVGCSKVPDINNVGLMEDRATLRISSQFLANWLYHEVCSIAQVEASLRKMAQVVDEQNADDSEYEPMAPSYDGIAFQAARALILEGMTQPSGYTEPLLHQYRKEKKTQQDLIVEEFKKSA